jgi:hypothetical protein
MPVVLPNLYTTPQDIYEMIGVDAAQLRLDDQNQASGQQLQASAGAIVGATAITLAANLQYPMLRGTRLVFENAGVDTPIEVTLDAAAAAGASSITVVALTTAITAGMTAIDNGVNVWLAALLVKATKYATSRIQDFCLTRYDDSMLVQSWTVNQWATTIACRWLGVRLFRAAPEQIESAYQEVMEELKAVKNSEMNLANIGPRTSEWPFISNVTVDLGYTYRKVRVETPISEPTPTQFSQAVDWNSALSFEW